MRERGLHQARQRRERGARGHRVGRVGRHQNGRRLAAPHLALEVARDLDCEQHLARGQHAVELRLVADQLRHLEIFGVLERLEDRAAEIARLLQQNRRRQIARRGVDGVAEQQKLHQRHHDDHDKRNTVAAKLDELLDQHRLGAKEPARCEKLPERRHWKLSFARPIRSMKTSSSDGAAFTQW
jgi:hypothetical protein